MELGELGVGGGLLGREVGRSDPELGGVLLDLHEGSPIKEEDVPGIKGCETLDGCELHRVGAGRDRLEAGAVEVVEMVVGGGPDAARGVEGEGEDEGFLDTVGSGEAVKLGAIVTEETVFGGDPEEALVVLNDFEDVEVTETFVLAVVPEGELLCSGGGCEKAEQKQEKHLLQEYVSEF